MRLKPVVFVPGLPGTMLIDATAGNLELFPSLGALFSTSMRPTLIERLSGPEDPDHVDGVVAGEPIRDVVRIVGSLIDFSGTLKQASSLYDILAALGYSIDPPHPPNAGLFRAVGWDWRRPVDQGIVQTTLADAIRTLHQAGGSPVTVICHSTGGLVVRGVLEKQPELADLIERVIAIAIPWAGTLQSLPQLAGQGGFGPLTAAETARIIGRSWAAFDLLPPDPAKTEMKDGEGDFNFFLDPAGHQASPLVATGWIPTGAGGDPLRRRAASADQRLGRRQRSFELGGRSIEVVNLVGWGTATLTSSQLDANGRVTFQTSDQGDGTIPRRSAAWLRGNGISTFMVPVGHYPGDDLERVHIVLWENQPVRDLLGVLLAGQPRPPYTYAAVDSLDATGVDVAQVHVRLVALDAAGQPLPNAFATPVGLNPANLDRTQYLLDADGRGMMRLSRGNIPLVQGGLGRFGVQFHWQENGAHRSSGPLIMNIQKS